MPKTGFSNGFADVPTKKYYKYHGWVRDCNTEPVLPPYLEFPNLPADPLIWNPLLATWLSPTAFEKSPDEPDEWYNEPYAWDGHTGIFAIGNIPGTLPPGEAWGTFVIYKRGKIACDRLKIWLNGGAYIDIMKIDVLTMGYWKNIYEGPLYLSSWLLIMFDKPRTVDKFRIKFHGTCSDWIEWINGLDCLIGELEFYGYDLWLFQYKALDPTGDFIRRWLSGDIYENRILTGEYDGRVAGSDDQGENFIELAPDGYFDKTWTIFVAAFGLYLAAQEGGRVFISLDYGLNWEEVFPAGVVDKPWKGADAEEGEIIIAAAPGRLYISHNYGNDWVERMPGGDNDLDWHVVSMSGQYILVGVYGGRLYTSNNYGATWTERFPAGDFDKLWKCGSIDQNIVVAGVYGGRLYLSTDRGVNWEEVRPAGDIDKDWSCCSVFGQYILVGISPGRLYFSGDYGINWQEVRPAGDTDKEWAFCKIVDEYAIAGADNGKVYRIDYSSQ